MVDDVGAAHARFAHEEFEAGPRHEGQTLTCVLFAIDPDRHGTEIIRKGGG